MQSLTSAQLFGAPKSARKTKARLARAKLLIVAARKRAVMTAQRYAAQPLTIRRMRRRKKPRFPAGGRGLRKGTWGQRRTFRAKEIAANSFRLPEKKNPAPRKDAGPLRDTPAPFSTGSPDLKGSLKGRRSLLRCRHFKCHIECDDCLLDSRLIDPSFSYMPRVAAFTR